MSESRDINQSREKQSRKSLVVLVILLIAWIIMTFLPAIFDMGEVRFLNDHYDRSIYFERGKWLPDNTPAISEYPQIPTFLFGINHIISMGFEPDFQIFVFTAIFSLEMIIVLYLVYKILLEILPPHRSNYALLLLLPPTLYFTYNRFDILPVLLCLIAYRAAARKNWSAVSILLAVATFTKWYPVLLFPGFFLYASTLESKFQWKMINLFASTSVGIILLSYLQGGLEAVLSPYQFHTARSMEYITLPVLINNVIENILNLNINLTYFFLFFFILQLSAPILIFFIKIDSLERLIHYCIVTIGIFLLFSRIWSPQWFLWLLPFMVILSKYNKDAWLIIAYNFITYLSFPIIFDYYGQQSLELNIAGIVTYLILIVIIIRSAKNFERSNVFVTLKNR